MPWSSRWTVDIPNVDLPTFVFPSQTEQLGTKPLLIDADQPQKYHLTHTTYRTWSKRLAAGLRAQGFQPGDRILLFSGNTLFFPVVFMGTVMAGGVFSGANPTYVARELAYQLSDTGAKFLICNEATLATGLEAADSIKFPRERIFAFDSGYADRGGYPAFDGTGKPTSNGIQHWSKLLASESAGSQFEWQKLTSATDLDRTVCLNYSSGTTGVPKGVEITHRCYVANTLQVSFVASLAPDYTSKVATAAGLCFLPMYHAYGQTYFCCNNPARGIPTYIMKKFDFIKMLQHVQDYRITNLTLVPPIAVALAKRAEVTSYDLSSVRDVGCGAAPLGSEAARQLEARFPSGALNVKQGWGMTEVTCSMTSWHPSDVATDNSIGELLPNCSARIISDADGATELGPNQRGEFWVRGPNRMKGYWRKPDATTETLSDDGQWLKTGDIAYRTPEGRIYIVDRKKELIKVKGNQVAPAELEALLLDHAEVADAAVVGVTIKGEELPRGYLVRRPGSRVGEKEVRVWMDPKVARHKRLEGGVVFVDEIPKNPSGKILRKILRDRAKVEVGDSEPQQAKL